MGKGKKKLQHIAAACADDVWTDIAPHLTNALLSLAPPGVVPLLEGVYSLVKDTKPVKYIKDYINGMLNDNKKPSTNRFVNDN